MHLLLLFLLPRRVPVGKKQRLRRTEGPAARSRRLRFQESSACADLWAHSALTNGCLRVRALPALRLAPRRPPAGLPTALNWSLKLHLRRLVCFLCEALLWFSSTTAVNQTRAI
ncbi:hypothetical protein R5R35_007675 [Gryllus longicercus]|uniref:Uncharacterized protein n=1 Tax=Gryllus longicercus TaxID=2509291 RepID=A0AAN9VD73_9ORTH